VKTTIKSPNVQNVLEALNAIQDISNMNKSELRELARELNKVADAFEASAPEETTVPHVETISLSLSDVARTIIDSYGLPTK
jgi:hypothetical protein